MFELFFDFQFMTIVFLAIVRAILFDHQVTYQQPTLTNQNEGDEAFGAAEPSFSLTQ